VDRNLRRGSGGDHARATVDEARVNLKDALELVLETQRDAAMKEAGTSATIEEILVASR
jgi:predicted RNase H-like HicB family nuclease